MVQEGSDLALGIVSPIAKAQQLRKRLGYSDDLFRRGYKIAQVEKVELMKASGCITNNISAKVGRR